MKRRKVVVVALAALMAVMAIAASAEAIKLRAGNIIIVADGGFTPTKLPRKENAPITIYGGGKISTVNGELPPILETIDIEFDRHGAVDTVGLPVCRPGQLEATTVEQARKTCGGRDRRQGQRLARSSSSPNRRRSRPPRRSRSSTARRRATRPCSPTPTSTVPVPTTFIVPVEIEKINKGIYGYRTHGEDPENRRRRRRPDQGPPDDRQTLDLQGQEAQLHQRPLRNRPPAGPRPVPLQRRHLPLRGRSCAPARCAS